MITNWNRAVGVVEGLTAPLWAVSEFVTGHGIADLKIDAQYADGLTVEPDLAD